MQRDPDALAQAQLERDPGAEDHHLEPVHQPRWLTPDTDPDAIDPVALGVLLSTIPADDPRYVAARLAVELRTERADYRQAGHQVQAAFWEAESERARWRGAEDPQRRIARRNHGRAEAWRRQALDERRLRRDLEQQLAAATAPATVHRLPDPAAGRARRRRRGA